MKKIFTLLLLAITSSVFSQTSDYNNDLTIGRTCGSMDNHDSMMENNPSYKANREIIEKFYQKAIQNKNSESKQIVFTIPVVVHVVHNGQAVGVAENISDAQVLSQIQILNEDFRALNSDFSNTPSVFSGIASDVEINFCLAVRDPSGAPTNGIDRIDGGQSSWNSKSDINTNLKPSTIWDRDDYLNLWTINFGGGASGLLGFAQFPGGSATTDGVVVRYSSVGNTGNVVAPYHLGRTATHEIGHWLDLLHTHQGGCSGLSPGGCSINGDKVCDTPQSANPTYGCPGIINTCTENPNNYRDMTMNYMSYADDPCMYMFTAGQKTRMHATLSGARSSLSASQGCMPATVPPIANFNADQIYISPGTTVNFFDASINFPTSWNWNFDLATSGGVTPLVSTIKNPSATYSNLGNYNVKMVATNPYGVDSVTKTTYIHVINCQDISIDIQMDNYASDVTWEIINDSSGLAILQGNGYSNVVGGQLITEELCLTNGCYTFKIYDQVGNGICCFGGNGSYTITNNTLTSILGSGGQFGSIDSLQFCISTETNAPVANFSSSSTAICEQNDIQFYDLSTNTASSWAWSFPGGTPNSSTLKNPVINYSTPGTFAVTLQAFNNVGNDTKTINSFITISGGPSANAGSNIDICSNNTGPINLSGSVSIATGGTWTTTGTGAFSGVNTLTATYTPSTFDITTGQTIIALTTTGNGTCNSASDNLIITYTAPPSVNAGANQTICENDSIIFFTATVNGASGVIWSGGNGTFVNDSLLSTSYIISSQDFSNGSITLSATSTGNGGCNAVSDNTTITFQDASTVDAGNDVTLCFNKTLILNGTFNGANGVNWSTDGSGVFGPISSMASPIYTPSADDEANGSVILTLSTTGNGVCNPSIDTLILTIEDCSNVSVSDDLSTAIRIFPNPAMNTLTINSNAIKIENIALMNTLGQKVKIFANNGNDIITLSISDLAKGTYILELSTEFGMIHKSINIQR